MNAKRFVIALSHAHFHFWGHEQIFDRSISKCQPKSDATPWIEKSQLQEHPFHAHDTGFIGRMKMLCMDVLSRSSSVESEGKCRSSPLSVKKKTLSILVWIYLKSTCTHPSKLTNVSPVSSNGFCSKAQEHKKHNYRVDDFFYFF